MRRLTTCGRCGGTARSESSTGFVRWSHVTPPAVPHPVDPDDSHVSGPDRSDLPPCSVCGHPEHTEDEGLCEERVGSGLYGSDGVEVTRWCACTGPDLRCGLCGRVPAEGEAHRQLYGVGETGEDAEEVCVGPDRHQLDYAPPVTPDPWTDPDAAAAASPPPF